MSDLLARAQRFIDSPQGQGLLGVIQYGEVGNAPNPWNTMFGGGEFADLSRHPRQINRSGQYASDAAGPFQMLSTTFDEAARALKLPDFSPRSQKLAAAYLIDRRTGSIGGLEGVMQRGFDQQVSDLLAPEWASLPTKSGRSYYGQPVKNFQELSGVYRKLAGGGAPVAAPASTPAPAPAAGNDPGDSLLADFASTQLGLANQSIQQQQQLDERRQANQLLRAAAAVGQNGGGALAGFLAGMRPTRMAGDELGLGRSGIEAVTSAMATPTNVMTNAFSALMRAATAEDAPTPAPAVANPGTTPSNAIQSTGGALGPVYITSGIGPTSTGPHLDLKPLNRQRFDPKALDNYIRVDGKNLTAFPVTDDWDGHVRRGSYGIDFGTPDGAKITLHNGAQVLSVNPTEHGDKLIIRTPSGDFSFLHGRAVRGR